MVNFTSHITTTTLELNEKSVALLRLSRWREHVPFTIALVTLGAMLAITQRDIALDWRLATVIAANILAMCFAFMINDVEDAPDDALDEKKRLHNVISSGRLTPLEGALASWLTCLAAFVLYAMSGLGALVLGSATLLLCYMYSAYPFRLKARPITDVLSHVLMLSGLLLMSGYFAYDFNPGIAWYLIIGAILFSAYGQFYNQIDDYDVDKAAGLKNTIVLLGKFPTAMLMYGCPARCNGLSCTGDRRWRVPGVAGHGSCSHRAGQQLLPVGA